MKNANNDFETIDQALSALHRSMYQHKSWEAIQQAAGVTLDRSAVAILKVLLHEGTARPLELARLLGIEAPSITRKLQQLESEELVSRQPDPKDGRAYLIVITKKGSGQMAKLKRARQAQLEAAFANWSEADQKAFLRLLRMFGENIDTHITKNEKENHHVK